MAFSQLIFLFVFFPFFIGGYMLCNYLTTIKFNLVNIVKECRILDLFLIFFSLIFYAWACFNDVFTILLYFFIVYFFGILIYSAKKINLKIGFTAQFGEEKQSKLNKSYQLAVFLFAISLIVITAILFFYKYFNFTIVTMNEIFKTGYTIDKILPPLGISFITFSAISYIADIYMGKAACGNIIDVLLYLSFFPKIASGPIMLYRDFSPQISSRRVSIEKFVKGLNLIMIGFGEKVILADTFGSTLSSIYSSVQYGIDVPTAWGSALLYMLQIYFDFSGYSHIAIGISELMGIEIKENFRYPYLSRSITEFWKRWHISLGTWFREYIYIPLGGNRKGTPRMLINLLIVFVITGLWHGAGWNYIWWGLVNGIFVVVERCIMNKTFYKKIPDILKWFVTMFVVFICWQLFRCSTIQEFKSFIDIMMEKKKFDFINYEFQYFFDYKVIFLMCTGILCSTIFGIQRVKKCFKPGNYGWMFIVKEFALLGLFVLSVICMVNSTYVPFLYFRF